jgi:competence protein ComEC
MPLLPIFNKSPFLRFLICYAAGIASSGILGHSSFFMTAVFILMAILLIWQIVVSYWFIGYYTGVFTGSLGAVVLFLAGLFTGDVHAMREDFFRNYTESPGYYRIRMLDTPQERAYNIKTTGRITHRMHQGHWVCESYLILVYFEKSPGLVVPEEGSTLLVKAALKKIPGPRNPGEFDYSRYLASRNIFRQVYLKKGTWTLSGFESWSPRARSSAWRRKLVNRLNTIVSPEAHRGLLAALTLGYREDLDAHTKQLFSEAGVMHVMALSGFNVGLIALVLEFLFGMFSGARWRICNTLLILVFLWFFALLTGLSASVLRATAMITLWMAGRLMHRKINPSNLLFAAAFFLLTFSPGLLSDVSFQLSFTAVTGIHFFQPLFYRKISSLRIVDKIWQLFTLSCAAQLATFPITLYYFHQFPVYFWLTNLYVVPMVSLIICLAGAFLLFTCIPPLAFILGQVLAALLKLLYGSVMMVENLPFSLIDNVYVNAGQVFLLFGILLTSALALYLRSIRLVYPVLLLFIVYQVTGFLHTYDTKKNSFLMVGNLRDRSVIIVKSGMEALCITDPGPVLPREQLRYSFGNFFTEQGIRQVAEFQSTDPALHHKFFGGSFTAAAWKGNLLMDMDGCRIIYLRDSRIFGSQSQHPIRVDVAVVSGSLAVAPVKFLRVIDARQVIMDASVKNYQAALWKKELEPKGIPCRQVTREGAWRIHLN